MASTAKAIKLLQVKEEPITVKKTPQKRKPRNVQNTRKRMVEMGVIEKKPRATKMQRTIEKETNEMMGKKEVPPVLSKELFESTTPFPIKLEHFEEELNITTKHVKSSYNEVKRERTRIDEMKTISEVPKKIHDNNKKLLDLCHRLKDKVDELQRQLNALKQQHLQVTNSTFQILSEQTQYHINTGNDTLIRNFVN